MELVFRPAEPVDVAVVFAWNVRLIDACEDPAAIDREQVLAWVRRKLEARIQEYTRITLQGETVGYFRFHPLEDAMELDDLYILPEFQNRGIGTSVIRTCCQSTDLPVILYVFTRNEGALCLYHRLGFTLQEVVSPTRQILRREPGPFL